MTAGGRPAGDGRRLRELDVLRGFALLGILLVNAELMAGPYTVSGGGPRAPAPDRVAAWLVSALVATKFSLLFSFLFGYGFALQTRSARHAGADFAPAICGAPSACSASDSPTRCCCTPATS